jgi:predicted AlkP superfamily phosphohydrolase/phosphomutase
MPRVAAIGLDAAEWQLIERMLDEGQLPCLARLRECGAECTLVNDTMYRSTLVWEAFITGHEDADDARSGGIAFDPETYRATKIPAGHAPPFYARFPDIEAIAFDVPHLSVASGARDTRICTWGTHSLSHPSASQPAGLLREIHRAFGKHPAFRKEHLYEWHRPRFVDWLTQALVTGCQRRAEVSGWLQERFPGWRLFLAVMSETHSAGENLGYVLDEHHPLSRLDIAANHRARLRRVYQAVDAAIGRFASRLPPDTVLVVFSLHGTGANDSEFSSTVLLPELLHRLRFGRPLLRNPDRRGGTAIVPAPSESWNEYMRKRASGEARGVRGRLRDLIPMHRFHGARDLAGRLADMVLGGRAVIGSDTSLEWQATSWYRSRWPQMKVFALPTFGDARLRVNVRGRERDGIVESAEYTSACDEIEAALRACRDPRTGGPVVAQTWRPRAADPMKPGGPDADIVVQWSHAFDALEHPDVGLIGPFPFRRAGGHTGRGFALFTGPGIPRADLGEHPAIDLPATILALLGEDPPSDLDGRPIVELWSAARPRT